MSRRRGEFEHRTSIFEGAFRAWSHLGGLNPEELEQRSVSELDPLDYPLLDDPRLKTTEKETKSTTPPGVRLYPYEPLPRTGLSHPYVQAILSPWLGPEADQDAIQLGLNTLRTWWQHRRKGESGTAMAALSSAKMKGVVEGYTRHFFNLAYCLVVNDKEQPPRTLHTKQKALDKARAKHEKRRARIQEETKLASLVQSAAATTAFPPPPPPPPHAPSFSSTEQGDVAAAAAAALDSTNLSPLERLHAAQRRQLAESGGVRTNSGGMVGGEMAAFGSTVAAPTVIDMKGKCIPGKIDLTAVAEAVSSSRATNLAHRGQSLMNANSQSKEEQQQLQYGDPSVTPVVFVSYNGDIQIAMEVNGITCAHCVKIVETVLKGCSSTSKSPIDGLLDAAADRALCQVLIKIDKSSNAKRIAFESARNLSMVGYTAKAKEMSIVNAGGDKKATMDLGALSTAFEVVATTDPQDVFDWNTPCSCPDNGILREDCARHSQMNTRIFEAFNTREKQVKDFMAGCGKKYGMPCTCGPDCRCASCEEHCKPNPPLLSQQHHNQQQPQERFSPMPYEQMLPSGSSEGGGAAAAAMPMDALFGTGAAAASSSLEAHAHQHHPAMRRNSLASRNPSILSFGGVLRRMSLTSDATFGRAMSGLSALSIDWENMEDFDVNVDHSAHIKYDNGSAKQAVPPEDTDGIAAHCNMMKGGTCNCGPDCLCVGCPIHDPPSSPPQPQQPPTGTNNSGGGGGGSAPRSNLRKSLVGGDSAQVTFKI